MENKLKHWLNTSVESLITSIEITIYLYNLLPQSVCVYHGCDPHAPWRILSLKFKIVLFFTSTA
jgi:hypothetical protein